MGHEKTVSMGLMMLIVIVIIIIFVVLALQWTKGQELTGTNLEFNSLCIQWQYGDCDKNSIGEIKNDKTTITEECLKLFDMGSDVKTITLCQDICENKCNPQISYDIGVYKENIRFTGTDHIDVEILNLGSGSIFGASVIIKDYSDTEIYNEPIDIPSHESKIIPIDSTTKYVDVYIDYIDTVSDNNGAINEIT